MGRPRLLDLFCGAGGCSVGYHRAGFDIVGVDIEPQPHYPFEFQQLDAIEVLNWIVDPVHATGSYFVGDFDAIHASPPCQDHSRLRHLHERNGTGWMLAATRDRLTAWGGPWILENVDGAGLPGQDDLFGDLGLMLCGAMFGLPLYRHRFFQASFPVVAPHHPRHLIPASKAGHWEPGTVFSVAGNCAPIEAAREAMGIDWMNRDELSQAIPPAYTEHVGAALLAQVEGAARAA